MADSSLLATFPIELIREIIRDSDASTLASWTLASRAFLAFAGPLLHEIVTLSRPQDVVPFLLRLANHNNTGAQHPSSSSLQSSFLSSLQRLEILALPSFEDSAPHFTYLSFVPQPVSVFKLNWDGQEAEDMTCCWIPFLVIFIRPQRYEQLGGTRAIGYATMLSGELLDCFLRVMQQPYRDALGLYCKLLWFSHQQQRIDSYVKDSLNLLVSPPGTSVLLDSLVVQLRELGAWFEGKSLLGKVDTVSGSFSAMPGHLQLEGMKRAELQKCIEEIKIEQARHDDAQILTLANLGLEQNSGWEGSGRTRSE